MRRSFDFDFELNKRMGLHLTSDIVIIAVSGTRMNVVGGKKAKQMRKTSQIASSHMLLNN